jgi:hypothetical protein
MNKKFIVGLIAALLLIPIIPAALAGPNWSVQTNKKYYQAGETVNITVKGLPGLANITIWKGEDDVLPRTEFTIPAGGLYNRTFTLASDAAVGLYNIVVESGIASAMTNFYVTKTSGEELAEEYLLVALRAKELANSTLEKLENTTLPPSVLENYEHGLDALEDAEDFMDQGKYEAALGAANRAQVHFMNAVKIALNAAGKDEEVPEEDALTAKIERGLELIVKLNTTVQNLEEGNEAELEEISGLLEEANVTLTSASGQVGVNNTKALELIKEAYGKIKEAQALLKEITKQHKHDMTLRFVERLELRIQKLQEAVERIRARLGVMKTNKMLASLENRLNAAERLMHRLQLKEEVNLNEIETMLEDLMDDIDDLKDDEYGQLLKQMDKIHASLGSFNDTLAFGLAKGWNMNPLKYSIVEANRDVDQALEKMTKGQRVEAMNQLKETESELKGNPFGWIIGERVLGK